MSGSQPEFYDHKFVCKNEGREVTRVRSTGVVKLKLNVVTKGMGQHGYQKGGGGGQPVSSLAGRNVH